jgi:hypothetical protein
MPKRLVLDVDSGVPKEQTVPEQVNYYEGVINYGPTCTWPQLLFLLSSIALALLMVTGKWK